MFYSVDISSSESFLRGGKHLTLTVQSTGDAMHVFINDQLSGTNIVDMFVFWEISPATHDLEAGQ